MIDELLSALQFVKSFSKVPVAVLISSLYPLIDKPPRSEGSVQLIPISNSLLTEVIGALG